ncbi:hypothetical protein [Paenarthrobacter ureafaciens]|uniref:hypothetical protein n=1 Tax=Paenarthrobacter ureafaciens TaxID=37931 RepID=UPI0019176E9F|nr:hypothetical protein [Paenarthrobacter ureafaciens]QQQ63241.1 hypothetical protein JHQ56_05315 [Paenarthrobacter ureafaciens]UOD82311.1 hypothetical protein MQZ73_05435 [Paenarthrobacter ureafaciens]WNZ05809.1 hypothetical protein PVT25_09985 [Paenarthrobacter ureafaciens]
MNSPHVFVAMADILNLRCDAWLLPTDSRVRIEDHWRDGHENLRDLAAEGWLETGCAA